MFCAAFLCEPDLPVSTLDLSVWVLEVAFYSLPVIELISSPAGLSSVFLVASFLLILLFVC